MKIAELFDVRGLATIVTGAASGIGYAYAEAMADNGARVAMLDIDRAGLAHAVGKLKAKGGDVRGAVVDVTDRPALRASFDEAARAFGRLDVLFANVGIDSAPGFLSMAGERTIDGAFENVSDERWDKVIATNFTSVFTSIGAAVPHMKKNRQGGRIIVTRWRRCAAKPSLGRRICPPKPVWRISSVKPRLSWRSSIFWSTP
jgi:NAD(P)-dependent dehydrogenase (short-subunit alcohol dehydrogenase family)